MAIKGIKSSPLNTREEVNLPRNVLNIYGKKFLRKAINTCEKFSGSHWPICLSTRDALYFEKQKFVNAKIKR